MGEVGARWDCVVTAGGTGGHVLPALALVDALEDAGVARDRIGFVGGLRGIEVEAVPAAGVDFVGLDVRGLRRSVSPAAIVANLVALWAMLRSVFGARRLLRRTGSKAVVSLGGYASVPAVLAAPRRAAVFVYESNSVPGVATRIAARKAVCAATAFESTTALLPGSVRVGFMVRHPLDRFPTDAALVAACAASARRAYGIEEGRRVVGVVGGSQGARSLNEAAAALALAWRDRDDLALVHLTGRRDHEEVQAATSSLRDPSPLRYVPVAFEDDMSRFYAVSDLVVCRSGAATAAELAATATPALCVPYPHATADHQRRNAAALVEAGAARMLDDAEVSRDTLSAEIGALLDAPARLEDMRAAAAALGAANGARILASRVAAQLAPDGVS